MNLDHWESKRVVGKLEDRLGIGVFVLIEHLLEALQHLVHCHWIYPI